MAIVARLSLHAADRPAHCRRQDFFRLAQLSSFCGADEENVARPLEIAAKRGHSIAQLPGFAGPYLTRIEEVSRLNNADVKTPILTVLAQRLHGLAKYGCGDDDPLALGGADSLRAEEGSNQAGDPSAHVRVLLTRSGGVTLLEEGLEPSRGLRPFGFSYHYGFRHP